MDHQVFEAHAQIGQPLLVTGNSAAWQRCGENGHQGVPPPRAAAEEGAAFLGAVGSMSATSSPSCNPSTAARLAFSAVTLTGICLKLAPFCRKTVCVPSF